MDGANIILGYVDDNTGEVRIFDETGVGHAHVLDEELGGRNNIVDYSGRQEAGRTVIEFSIPLKSQDGVDKDILPGTVIPVIVAFHKTADDRSTYHGSNYITLSATVEAPMEVETSVELIVPGERFTEGDRVNMTVVLTTLNGTPVPNMKVEVYITTTFDNAEMIKVGEGITDSNGRAEVPVTLNVPGEFEVVARFPGGGGSLTFAPSISKAVKIVVAEAARPGGPSPKNPFYNWAWYILGLPHSEHGTVLRAADPATLTVMVPLFAVILGVWLTYAYVYFLIFRIRRLGEKR